MNRIGHVFFGELGYRNAQNYIRGLMGSTERKNGWQLSEYIGEKSPEKLQQFIYRGSYSADALRDELRVYVAEHIGGGRGGVSSRRHGIHQTGSKIVRSGEAIYGNIGENMQLPNRSIFELCVAKGTFADRQTVVYTGIVA
jgi:hypothetical protein